MGENVSKSVKILIYVSVKSVKVDAKAARTGKLASKALFSIMDRKKKTNLAAFGKPVKYSFKETVLSSQGTEIIFI